MARDYLSGFEQIVLAAVLQTHGDAYGVTIHRAIKDRTRRDYSFGAIYATLDRLEAKGFVSSRERPPTPGRGGRPRRLFTVTANGQRLFNQSRQAMERMWAGLTMPAGARA